MSQQSNSSISFPFQSNIWKLLLDEVNDILILEIRNSENRSANFAGFDLHKKNILWNGLKLEESWWLGAEQVKDGKIILHEFKDPQNPQHKGIIVVETTSGKILWQNKELSLFSVLKDQVLAYNPDEEERIYLKLDLQTGKKSGELKEKDLLKNLDLMMNSKSGAAHGEDLKNAFHFTADHPYFEKIADFVKESMNMQPVGAMDYLEEGKFMILSFYSQQPSGLINHLLLMDDEGLVRYKEVIGKDLKGVGMDTFFVYKNMIIFVKDKNELMIHDLPKK